MFIPLYDTNSLKYIKKQYVTISLIVINVVVWLFTDLFVPQETAHAAAIGLGFIPAVVFDYAHLEPALELVPPDATLITYAFLHANFMHLASNMLFLWVFGDNVEDALGHVRFLIFYLLCAIAGALFHGMLMPTNEGPLIGASGAVSGVIAAYFILHPKVWVWVLILFRVPVPLPSFIPLAFWIGQQFVMLALNKNDTTSWGAHVGGLLAGAVLVLFMRRRGVPLFDRTIVTPKAVRHETADTKTAQPARTERSGTGIRWGR
jgi:membrane associated rhomboid family serine protease